MEEHLHIHDAEQTRRICNRLSRAIGHLEAVKKMVEDNRDCSEVLIQLAAVNAAIKSTSKQILRDHMAHCVTTAVKEGDEQMVEELYRALDQMLK